MNNTFFASLKTPFLYLASAAIVLAALALIQPSEAAFSWYFCASFWGLVAFDFYFSQVRQNQIPTRFSFEDRFIGYLFSAAFIWPVRLYRLMQPGAAS